jgi:DNA-binding response OmpR family regulator
LVPSVLYLPPKTRTDLSPPDGGARNGRPAARVLLASPPGPESQTLHTALAAGGVGVTVVPDAPFAVGAAAPGGFDVVVVDLGLAGFPVIRQLSPRPGAAFLLAILPGGDTERTLALNQGADDCLSRPADPREVLARVRALLRRDRSAPAPERRCSPHLEINWLTREVRRGGRSLRLTTREFALLVFLVENRGKVVTTEALRQHLTKARKPACPTGWRPWSASSGPRWTGPGSSR